MRVQRMVLPLSLALMGLSGCNVYDRWSGTEFNAGPVDVVNFPAEYLGAGGSRQIPGYGVFQAKFASAGEQRVEYFLFSLPTGVSVANALTLRRGSTAVQSTPSAYVFDSCKAPASYTYNLETEAVNLGEQGTIFTRLPTATYNPGAAPTSSYVPIVSKVQVTSNGVACQQLKSEEAVIASREVVVPLTAPVNGKMVGIPDSTYHAYAIIDPGASVFHGADISEYDEEDNETPIPYTGLGIQKWGWYNQYMLAYIDGGQVPTTLTIDSSNREVVSIVPQKLYYPSTKKIGTGFDVLEAQRGQPGYSPVCRVYTYDPGAATELPTSTAQIEADYASTIKAVTGAGTYVYCLQAENQDQ